MSDRVNVELFSLTYGSLVRAIVKETNNIEDANAKLMKIGTSVGNRITDDFVVHYENCRFKNLREACDSLVDYSLKTYLGINATISESSDTRCVIRFGDNPITRYVVIPPEYDGLIYLMPLLGAIKTAFQMLHYSTEVTMLPQKPSSNGTIEIEIRLNEILHDTLPPGEYIN